MGKTNKKRVVLSEPLILVLNILEDVNDRNDLLNALISYGKGNEVNKEAMYSKVVEAFEYFTKPEKEDLIFIDDKCDFE